MPTVKFSGPTNSTFFTTCCGSAIDDEIQCPTCKQEITPRSHRGRWEVAMQTLYGAEGLRKMRAKYPIY